METAMQLIKSTCFEQLLQNIRQEELRRMESERLKQEKDKNHELINRSFRVIYLSVMSSYFYLRRVHNMPERPLTLQEFEAVTEHLKKIGGQTVKKFRHRLVHAFRIDTAWHYYLKHGHFPEKKTPFGRWYDNHPLIGFNHFDPFADRKSYRDDYNYSIPPNIDALIREIKDKQLGQCESERKGE